MKAHLKLAALALGAALATHAGAQVTFYQDDNFGGRSFSADQPVDDFVRRGFNDRASSVRVVGEPWQVCEDADYGGRCVVLRPGRYPSLSAMGLENRLSSARVVRMSRRGGDDGRYGEPQPVYRPDAQPVQDYRRRGGERLYEANVTMSRAVMGAPEQRCWVERTQVEPERNGANVPGAIAGALIGGILGHQVGGGFGKDVATAGGVVAGAAVGAQVGRGNGNGRTQDVQRCANAPGQARPAYWDVSYRFRGQDHRVQMTQAPGATVTVNRQGEPRT